MPKATAVFDADDSRLSGALARINGKMLALQSRIAKVAAAFIAIRAVAGVVTGRAISCRSGRHAVCCRSALSRRAFKQALGAGGQLKRSPGK